MLNRSSVCLREGGGALLTNQDPTLLGQSGPFFPRAGAGTSDHREFRDPRGAWPEKEHRFPVGIHAAWDLGGQYHRGPKTIKDTISIHASLD